MAIDTDNLDAGLYDDARSIVEALRRWRPWTDYGLARAIEQSTVDDMVFVLDQTPAAGVIRDDHPEHARAALSVASRLLREGYLADAI